MKSQNIKTYDELPEEDKDKYKPINEKGDFAEKTAIEDPEVAHRIAILKNDAYGELEESIRRSGLSVDDILKKLKEESPNYDEKKALLDLLFQNADLQRMKGVPIDEKIKETLEKHYTSLRYSDILTKKLINGIDLGDVAVIGEVLKDERMTVSNKILEKLVDDEQRLQAFKICKSRMESACSIINRIKDLDLALKMYSEILGLAKNDSYSDNNNLESTGEVLALKVFQTGSTDKLIELVGLDIFKLSYLRRFMHLLGSNQPAIIDLVKNSEDIKDIYYPLRFISDPKLLDQLADDPKSFSKLTNEQKSEALEYLKIVSEALSSEPRIVALSELAIDKFDIFAKKKLARNKFVVGIQNGRYYIAWSDIDQHEYHKDIFEVLGGMVARSGGYIGRDETDGKISIRMVRSSGDFGYYSKELLERFREPIIKKLKTQLGGKDFEFEIKISTEYE